MIDYGKAEPPGAVLPKMCECGHSPDDHMWRGPAADECMALGCDCDGFEWEDQ